MLDPRVRSILAELKFWGQENDRAQEDRSRKMLNLERETAQLAAILLAISRAERVLEIGTSNGYSTIWLAGAVAAHNGRVVSIERNPEKLRMAKENLERAGMLDRTELLLGSATDIVARLEGPFDAVFFDADRFSAPDQLALLLPKLSLQALLLADNALSHPDEIAGYLTAIRGLPDFEHVVIPVGKGLSIASRMA